MTDIESSYAELAGQIVVDTGGVLSERGQTELLEIINNEFMIIENNERAIITALRKLYRFFDFRIKYLDRNNLIFEILTKYMNGKYGTVGGDQMHYISVASRGSIVVMNEIFSALSLLWNVPLKIKQSTQQIWDSSSWDE